MMAEELLEATPVKIINELSSESINHCLLCEKKVTNSSNRRNLYNDGKKIDICIKLEELLGFKIGKLDLKILCRKCYRQVLRTSDKRQNVIEQYEKVKRVVEEKFVISRKKRASKECPNASSSSRKRLQVDNVNEIERTSEPSDVEGLVENPKLKVTVEYDGTKEIFDIGKSKLKIVKSLLNNRNSHVLHQLLSNHDDDDFKNVLQNFVTKQVSNEAKSLTKSCHFNTKLENSNIKSFSFDIQRKEVLEKAPLSVKIFDAFATSSRIGRNKLKTRTSILPSILTSINTLLLTRNQNCNLLATIIGLILKRGQAEKLCISRLARLSLSVSYNTVISAQTNLGKTFLTEVNEWIKQGESDIGQILQMKENVNQIEDDIPVINDKISKLNISFDPDCSFLDIHAKDASVEEIEPIDPMETQIDNMNDVVEIGEDSNDIMKKLIDDLDQDYLMYYDEWQDDEAESERTRKVVVIPKEINMDQYFTKKFMYVGDNLNIKINCRSLTLKHQSKMLNMFNAMAVLNRVPTPSGLFGIPAKLPKTEEEIDMNNYLPTTTDKKDLLDEITFLISRDLLHYLKDFSWAKPHFKSFIDHPYMEYTSTKSQIYPLGILNHDETSHEGMYEILKHAHQFVPGHMTNHLLKLFFIGDLKTVERGQQVQLEHRDSNEAWKKFEGFIPALADFHTYGNFLAAIWRLLYNTKSAGEIGTLYQARNFLNARGVKTDPMKSVNDSEELIVKFSEALLLTAVQQIKNDDPWFYDRMVSEENINLFKEFVGKIVHQFIVVDMEAGASSEAESSSQSEASPQSELSSQTEDCVFNYSKNALTLGYLAKNFLDARKYADGQRIIRLHKYLMLFFKSTNKYKYAVQVLHLLAQVSDLLPPALAFELIWNRSVNNRGFPSTNVELDRELEHRNKTAKKELGHMEGKITQKSIDRVSKSYQEVKDLIDDFDEAVVVSKSSGRHKKTDWSGDVVQLSEQFCENNIFLKKEEGRRHNQFKSVPESFMSQINKTELDEWIKENVLKSARRMNIYKSKDISS